jgi:hypothetical protein
LIKFPCAGNCPDGVKEHANNAVPSKFKNKINVLSKEIHFHTQTLNVIAIAIMLNKINVGKNGLGFPHCIAFPLKQNN